MDLNNSEDFLYCCIKAIMGDKQRARCKNIKIYGCEQPYHNLSHYNGVIMSTMASQITSLTIVYSTVCSGTDERKHQSPASLAFVRGIHQWPVNFPHKGPVTQKMLSFDNVIILSCNGHSEGIKLLKHAKLFIALDENPNACNRVKDYISFCHFN